MILKWICFILSCLDVVSYIIEGADRIKVVYKMSEKIGRCIGLCVGIAARVYVLYGAGTFWLYA